MTGHLVSCLTPLPQMFARLLKLVALGAVVMLCYEAAMQGTEATRETVLLAAREDLTSLAKLASPWLKKLVVILGDKIQTVASRYIDV